MPPEHETIFRLSAAALVGMALGINRDLAEKPVGMRTLALVSLGAAAVTLCALQIPFLSGHPDGQSRVLQGVIQGVLTGVGFVGAGVVLHLPEERRVRGLTTAATVWITASLGIACGLGAWLIAAFCSVLALLLLGPVQRLERALERAARLHRKARRRGGQGGAA